MVDADIYKKIFWIYKGFYEFIMVPFDLVCSLISQIIMNNILKQYLCNFVIVFLMTFLFTIP